MINIGFIGLGQMGSALAERILAVGRPLFVQDPAPAAVAALKALGAESCDDAAEIAARCDVVVLCLPDAQVSQQVARALTVGPRVTLVIETSTVGRPCLEEMDAILGAAGIELVDAPISGGPRGARSGRTTMMASGRPEAMEAAREVLGLLSDNLFAVGELPGKGQVMKLVNNLLSGALMAASYEALVVGAKAGLDAEIMVEVLNASSARNTATLEKVPQSILPGTFDFGASIRTITKDMRLGLAEADVQGVPTWACDAAGRLWRLAEISMGPEHDYTSLIRLIEGYGGTVVRSRAVLERNDKKSVVS